MALPTSGAGAAGIWGPKGVDGTEPALHVLKVFWIKNEKKKENRTYNSIQ